jgi:hypothetical protein
MDTEFEETVKKSEEDTERPALISDPVIGRVGDQELFERRKRAIVKNRQLQQKEQKVEQASTFIPDEYTNKQQNNRNTPIKNSPTRAVERGEVGENQLISRKQYSTTRIPSTQNPNTSQIQKNIAPEDKLNFTSMFLLIGTALLFDALQAICTLTVILLPVSYVVTFVAFMTFWFWFRTKGIKFNTKVRSMSFGGASVLELIPFLSALPGWTLAVSVIILTTKGQKFASLIPGGEKVVEMAKKVS